MAIIVLLLAIILAGALAKQLPPVVAVAIAAVTVKFLNKRIDNVSNAMIKDANDKCVWNKPNRRQAAQAKSSLRLALANVQATSLFPQFA